MKKWLLLASIFLLGACGFQLRGLGVNDTLLPFHKWTIVNGGIMQAALTRELKRQQNVELVSADQAEAILHVLSVNTDRRTQSINLEGSTSEYSLTLVMVAQIERQGVKISEPMVVRVHHYMDYSDNFILGKGDEEARLWSDMRAEAANQLMTRIAIINRADVKARQ